MTKLHPNRQSKELLPPAWAKLSQAERRLIRYLGRGWTATQIGAALSRSPGTIRNQFTVLLRKLGVPTRYRLLVHLRGGAPEFPCTTASSKKMYNDPVTTLRSSLSRKRATPLRNPWPVLSPAEHRVAIQLIRGFGNQEIAHAVGRRQTTVKNQLRSIFRRTGYDNRLKLALALMEFKEFANPPVIEAISTEERSDPITEVVQALEPVTEIVQVAADVDVAPPEVDVVQAPKVPSSPGGDLPPVEMALSANVESTPEVAPESRGTIGESPMGASEIAGAPAACPHPSVSGPCLHGSHPNSPCC